jgi:hypothetical protein
MKIPEILCASFPRRRESRKADRIAVNTPLDSRLRGNDGLLLF